MAKEMEFFSFLMEQYAAYKETTANKILAQLVGKPLFRINSILFRYT